MLTLSLLSSFSCFLRRVGNWWYIYVNAISLFISIDRKISWGSSEHPLRWFFLVFVKSVSICVIRVRYFFVTYFSVSLPLFLCNVLRVSWLIEWNRRVCLPLIFHSVFPYIELLGLSNATFEFPKKGFLRCKRLLIRW